MTDDLIHLEVLASFPNEIDASLIANALDAEGVTAVMTGVNTASFRAEAPGLVNIMIRREDLDRSRQILVEFQNSKSETDWDNVDVGEPE